MIADFHQAQQEIGYIEVGHDLLKGVSTQLQWTVGVGLEMGEPSPDKHHRVLPG